MNYGTDWEYDQEYTTDPRSFDIYLQQQHFCLYYYKRTAVGEADKIKSPQIYTWNQRCRFNLILFTLFLNYIFSGNDISCLCLNYEDGFRFDIRVWKDILFSIRLQTSFLLFSCRVPDTELLLGFYFTKAFYLVAPSWVNTTRPKNDVLQQNLRQAQAFVSGPLSE